MSRLHKTDLTGCKLCGRDVRMFSPEEAAGIAGIETRKIYEASEAGRIHVVELPEGLLLVCLDSY